MGTIFCKKVWQWELRVPWIAPQHRRNKWPGHIVKFSAFYNKYHNMLIVRHLEDSEEPIDCHTLPEAPGVNLVSVVSSAHSFLPTLQFPVQIAPTDTGAVYTNPHLGFVNDPDLVVGRYNISIEDPPWVYVRYVGGIGLIRSKIVCHAEAYIPSSFAPSPERV